MFETLEKKLHRGKLMPFGTLNILKTRSWKIDAIPTVKVENLLRADDDGLFIPLRFTV